MEPPDALDDVGSPAAATAASDAHEVTALRRQVESLQLAKAQLEKQLEAAHLDWQLHNDDPNGLDRSGDLFSEESQEVINSSGSEGEGSDGCGADSDDGAPGGAGGGGARTTSGGDRGADQADVDKVMEENAGVPVPVRRESRTVSAEMFPAQATSVSKTIKPRASFRLLIEVHANQYVWWEFATANRDIAFGVQFHCPSPEVKYNTADALVEGILTQARGWPLSIYLTRMYAASRVHSLLTDTHL
jgi:hypothetical protein